MRFNKKKIFTAISIGCLVVSLLFLCACIDIFAHKVFDIVTIFKPMKADRVEQLKGVFLGNALLFFVYSILFILLQFLHFETTNVTLHFLPPYLHFTSMSAFIHSLKEKLSQRHVIAVILVFIGISGIRFYWMNQKVAFHEDEVYSVSIVTQNEYGLWSGKDFNQNQAYTGKQIKEAIFLTMHLLKTP